MEHLRKILKEFVKETGIDGGAVLNAVRKKWNDIVGQAIGGHTYPDTIRGKVLTIIVDTPQWLHHLGFYKEEISEKLGPYNVGEVRFRLGRVPEISGSRNDKEKENVELSDEDIRYLENTLRNIKDEELKEKLRTLIVHGLKKGKK